MDNGKVNGKVIDVATASTIPNVGNPTAIVHSNVAREAMEIVKPIVEAVANDLQVIAKDAGIVRAVAMKIFYSVNQKIILERCYEAGMLPRKR